MTRKTGSKWSTVSCSLCGKPHDNFSGKLDANGDEYVICSFYDKKVYIKRFDAASSDPRWKETV